MLTASTDVLLGLKKLCFTVSSAMKLFASVEPPVVRFTKTILIIVTPDGDLAELKDIYHPRYRTFGVALT